MKSLLSLVLLTLVGFTASAGQACEKHLDGHQNGSDTQSEVSGR